MLRETPLEVREVNLYLMQILLACAVDMTVSSVYGISLTDRQIFIKPAWIYHWDMPSSWLDLGNHDLVQGQHVTECWGKGTSLLGRPVFRRDLVCRKANRKSLKLSPCVNIAENVPSVFRHLEHGFGGSPGWFGFMATSYWACKFLTVVNC